MNKYLAALTLTILLASPAYAQDHSGHGDHDMSHMEEMKHDHHKSDKSTMTGTVQTVRQVEPQMVCMVNDTAFDTPQIAVEVEGATYYGCCPMCKERLEKDASIRKAIDPVSGNEVDKAQAVIGADAEGKVHYFESEENLHAHMAH